MGQIRSQEGHLAGGRHRVELLRPWPYAPQLQKFFVGEKWELVDIKALDFVDLLKLVGWTNKQTNKTKSLRKRCILYLKMSPKVWYPAVSNLEANCWLENLFGSLWGEFDMALVLLSLWESIPWLLQLPQHNHSHCGVWNTYLIKATFENSSSITEFSFPLKAFSGRIARWQHSLPSTLFPAKTE